jgi:hypothetical protein
LPWHSSRKSYLRVMPAAHAATPLGMGFGHTRFSSPDHSFRLVYIARDLATAIAETIVRDRFEGATERVLDYSEIEEWAVAEVTALSPLQVLDLRTTGLLRLGVSTDAARAKAHREGQQLSKAVYGAFAVDALLYSSRLTSAECLAVYDRAAGRQTGLVTGGESRAAPRPGPRAEIHRCRDPQSTLNELAGLRRWS